MRTGTYYAAILENAADFEGKVVMDVGAGSGILSLFAAQVGLLHLGRALPTTAAYAWWLTCPWPGWQPCAQPLALGGIVSRFASRMCA